MVAAGEAKGLPGTPKDGTEALLLPPKGVVLTGSVVVGATDPKEIALPNVGATAGAGAAVDPAPGSPNRFMGDLFSLGLKKDFVLATAGVDVAPAGTVKVISAAG